MHHRLKFKVWNYLATRQKKLATPWLRTAALARCLTLKLWLTSQSKKFHYFILALRCLDKLLLRFPIGRRDIKIFKQINKVIKSFCSFSYLNLSSNKRKQNFNHIQMKKQTFISDSLYNTFI